MAEYNMPQYILREFKVTDARVSRLHAPTLVWADLLKCRFVTYSFTMEEDDWLTVTF